MLNKMMDEFCSTYRVKGTEVNESNVKKAINLIDDELGELYDETLQQPMNIEATGFELADIIYIAAQQARQLGYDVDALLAAKHASNMSKTVSRALAAYELQVARERYPEAYIDEGQNYCVLRDAATNKVIKPTTYTPAKAKQEYLPHA